MGDLPLSLQLRLLPYVSRDISRYLSVDLVMCADNLCTHIHTYTHVYARMHAYKASGTKELAIGPKLK